MPVLETEFSGNAAFGHAGTSSLRFVRQHDGETEEILLATAEQCEGAVRWDISNSFAGIEVVGELRAFFFLARHDGRLPLSAVPQQLTQSADEFRVLGERLHQNPACALECCSRIGDALLRVDERRGLGIRNQHGILQQTLRQRLQSGLARDLAARAALRLEGQVEIFKASLRIGLLNGPGQLRRQLALFLDAFQDCRSPILELAQIGQPLFERAELGVIEPTGGFLAIPGDERNGGFVVEKSNRGLDLWKARADVLGNALSN